MTPQEWALICRITKEEKKMAQPLTDAEKAREIERQRLEAVYKRNRKLGYHATVYVDPVNNKRRRACSYLSKIMPTTKCAERDGNPIANIFKGVRLVEEVGDDMPADLKKYEAEG